MQGGGELVALFTPAGSPKQNTLARLLSMFDFPGIRQGNYAKEFPGFLRIQSKSMVH